MFGELALSERAIADQGILAFGSATADANFTVDGASMFVANGSAEMEAIGVKATIAVGVLAGIFEASAQFLQSTGLTRFGTIIVDMDFSTVQTANGTFVASAISEQDAVFIQSTNSVMTLSAASEQSANFTQTSAAGVLYSASQEMTAEFIQSVTPTFIINSRPLDIQSVFIQTSLGAKVILMDELQINAVFIVSAEGRFYWERIDADDPSENWVQVVPSGGTWTEINAGGTIETWTDKVV
jgi:hypothetical protein